MHPNFKEEKKLWNRGYKIAIGLDEAGRGPLAGPVIAAAISVRKFSNLPFLKAIKDSKQLTPCQREEFYKILTKHPKIRWGVGKVSEKIIDKINILEATKLAMKKAIADLRGKPLWHNSGGRSNSAKTDFLILDGNFALDSDIPQKSIIRGDEKVFSCAAASIIAKVTRDRLMVKYHKKYPEYGFDAHKGYPTLFHRQMLKKYGICPIHRKTFRFCES